MFPPVARSMAAERGSAWLTAALVGLAAGVVVLAGPWPVRVVDGDTVDRFPFRHRLVGYDSPEIRRARCPAERALGEAAAKRLAAVVSSGRRIDLVPVPGRDPYGRRLSRLEVDGLDVAALAIAEGWGVAAGRRRHRDWCGPQD